MNFTRFSILALGLTTMTFSVWAGGTDLTLLHSTRQVYLGGQHVSLRDDSFGSFYNPASLGTLTRPRMALSNTNVLVNYEAPLLGVARSSDTTWGPLFYLGGGYPLNDRVSFGLAVFSTNAQGGKFSNVDYGAGLTDKEFSNLLLRIEIAPSVSFKLDEHLFVGASYRIGYTKYEKNVGTLLPSYLEMSASSWDFKGLKIGGLLDDLNGFSMGLTYRIPVSLEMDGTSNLTLGGVAADYDTVQKVTIPAAVQVGATYEWLKNRLMSSLTYEWVNNSKFDTDTTELDGLPTALTYTPLNYRDTHSIHFGTEYTFQLAASRFARLGAGLGFETATVRKEFPNPILPPDAPFFSWSIGGQYGWSIHKVGLAFNYGAYEHETTAVDTSLTGVVFPGTYKQVSYTIALDYEYAF